MEVNGKNSAAASLRTTLIWTPCACWAHLEHTRKLKEIKDEIMVPGGGVEPPRPEGRRILSPLRLPVPPSRHGVWESALKVSHSPCPCAKAFRYWGALPAVALFLYPHAEAFPAKPPWPVAAAGIRRRNSHYSRNLGLDPAFHTSRCRLNVTVVRQLRQS